MTRHIYSYHSLESNIVRKLQIFIAKIRLAAEATKTKRHTLHFHPRVSCFDSVFCGFLGLCKQLSLQYLEMYRSFFPHKFPFLIHDSYEGWNFNSGNCLFTTDTK